MDIFRLNQKTAAALLSVAPRTLRDWTDAPRLPSGLYSGPELVQWMLDRRSPDGDAFDDQRQRLAAAQAEKVERENAVQRGELARRADVERVWLGHIAAARARLLRLPSECGARVAPELRAVVLTAVTEGVHEALRDLAEGNHQ